MEWITLYSSPAEPASKPAACIACGKVSYYTLPATPLPEYIALCPNCSHFIHIKNKESLIEDHKNASIKGFNKLLNTYEKENK